MVENGASCLRFRHIFFSSISGIFFLESGSFFQGFLHNRIRSAVNYGMPNYLMLTNLAIKLLLIVLHFFHDRNK
jgi:hypothetical protein